MSRPSCATATPAIFQRGLDLTPQSRCNRLEPRPINGPIADAVPPAKHPLGQAQQDTPRSFPTAPTIDHGLEIPLQVRPADLSPRRIDPLERAVSVAGNHLVRLAPQQRLDHRAGSFGRDGEDRRHRGQDHPQLSLAAILAPRGVVDAGRLGVMDGERHFVVGGFQRRGRLPLELGDHTRGDRETEQVADHLLDLSLAETVAAGERGQHGLQIRPETARGDSFWKAPTRRYAAVGAGKAMKSVLVDQRFDLGQLGDLVNQRSRVVTGQGLTAATAIRGPTIGDRAHLLRRDQAALCPAMSRLPTPFPTGGWRGRLAFEPDGIGRRRLGGIGGVELEPALEIANTLLEFGDPSLEGLQHGQDGNLGFRWDGVPEWFRDRRLRLHANNTTE